MSKDPDTMPDRDPANAPTREAKGHDSLSSLMRFHGRIRAALASLDELAGSQNWDTAHQVEARALVAFFTGPLVWHDVDEETSLLPRLRRRARTSAELELLDAITDAHEHMEHTIDRLLPPLQAAAAEPPPEAVGLEDLARELRGILEPHLAMEEQHLVPLARRLLTAGDLEGMAAEIAHRDEGRRHGVKNAVEI